MKKTRGGFTLIEMALSLVFIGILSVMMVLLIQNTMSSYRRGLILNQLNTVGMDLMDDIRQSIQNAGTDSLLKLCERKYGLGNNACTDDNGNSFVSVTKYGNVTADGVSLGSLPIYGAFCTGTYTYIWNSGYLEQTDYGKRKVDGVEATLANKGAKLVDGSNNVIAEDFRLLKIYDRERTVCVNANNWQTPNTNGDYVTSIENGEIKREFVIDNYNGVRGDKNAESKMDFLRTNGANDLALYDFYMSRPATSETRKNLFFAGSFILGTKRGGINIKKSGNSCKPPSDEYSALEYCAINKFNFAVQAGGN